jgi:hypothetical protein
VSIVVELAAVKNSQHKKTCVYEAHQEKTHRVGLDAEGQAATFKNIMPPVRERRRGGQRRQEFLRELCVPARALAAVVAAASLPASLTASPTASLTATIIAVAGAASGRNCPSGASFVLTVGSSNATWDYCRGSTRTSPDVLAILCINSEYTVRYYTRSYRCRMVSGLQREPATLSYDEEQTLGY